MKNVIISDQRGLDEIKADEIQHSLDSIERRLDEEIAAKQRTIDRQEMEIQRLYQLLEEKGKIFQETSNQLAECMRKGEGNRQLINKLLNDIDRLSQDIEWYKRTYEKRSIFGIIKDKLK